MHKALWVGTGIFLSRLTGLVRLRVFAHYFGLQSDAADAFNVAFRIPNFLQNLFGEGALSASFIPTYAGLRARGEDLEADRVAGAVAALLGLMVAGITLAGILAAPLLVAIIAPGFDGAKRELTTRLVRILFPGAGLLVVSAWCLGVLNSHRRFLLSYTAPVMWNAAMIATLLALGPSSAPEQLAVWLAWGSVVGSALQCAVQLPAVRRVAPGIRLFVAAMSAHVRRIVVGFVPVLFSRGVVQVSAYIDAMLASLLPTGAVTGLANAQLLYTLPVSLFGMSMAAAELPSLAGDVALNPTTSDAVRARLEQALRRVAFFVVPSAAAFLALGDIVAAGLLQTGRFRREDAVYVWGILAGSAVGLLPSTLGRLYASTYYALGDTRTPLRYAIVHVVLATTVGYILAIPLPGLLGVPPLWGAAGLTLAAGFGGWVELVLLRRTLERRIGRARLAIGYTAKLWLASATAAATAWGIRMVVPAATYPVVAAIAILGPYGVVYLGTAAALRIPELANIRRVALRLE